MSIRKFAIFIVKTYVTLFYRHKVYGKEHVVNTGALIAANHFSFIDPPIVGVSYPLEVHFLARDTLFSPAPFGWLIRKLNSHPVARGKGNAAAFKKTCELVEKGHRVVIFPEGTRSKDGNLQPGQLGVGMLVTRTKCLVVPTYIHGTFEAWPQHKSYPKLLAHTACIFGSPLDFSSLMLRDDLDKREIQQLIADATMEAISRLRKWYLDGALGTPP